jgi:microcystin-dependent protein
MSCTNCFNGCVETVSDQCVKYTGINVPELGISTGDPLSVIEQSLTTFLVSTLNGSGVKIDLSSIDVCTAVQQYLPTCGELSIADISKALIEAACDIQDQVDAIDATLAVLNADYTIPVDPITGPCLTGVTSSSDTHAIVQATITKLCSVDASLTFVIGQLSSYALKSEICTLVEECASGTSVEIKAQSNMLPYSVIPYYGAVSGYPTVSDGFSSTGAGYGYWLNVYVCNGQNPGVPDLRGRVAVGSTDMGSVNWPSQTNPAGPGNPTYGYKTATSIQGTNTTVLSLGQMPLHTHGATTNVRIYDPGHDHTYEGVTNSSGAGEGSRKSVPITRTTDKRETGLKGTGAGQNVFVDVTNAPQGNNEAHSNVQPGLAVYYLIYIPA